MLWRRVLCSLLLAAFSQGQKLNVAASEVAAKLAIGVKTKAGGATINAKPARMVISRPRRVTIRTSRMVAPGNGHARTEPSLKAQPRQTGLANPHPPPLRHRHQ